MNIVTRLTKTLAVIGCCWFALSAVSVAAPNNPQPPGQQSHNQQSKSPSQNKSSNQKSSSSTKKYPHQHRIENQQDRLNRQYEKGKISQSQYKQDKSNLHSIKHTDKQDAAANGGKLTSQERSQTKSALKQSGTQIHNQKSTNSGKPPK